MLKKYVSESGIEAKPMSRGEYHDLHGWGLDANDDPDDEGFLVVQDASHPVLHRIAWLPAGSFHSYFTLAGESAEVKAVEVKTAAVPVNGMDQQWGENSYPAEVVTLPNLSDSTNDILLLSEQEKSTKEAQESPASDSQQEST